MGEHSSLRLLLKLVRIISFLLLWQFGCGIRAGTTGQVRPAGTTTTAGSSYGKGEDANIDGLPYGYGGIPRFCNTYGRSCREYPWIPGAKPPTCPENQGLPCDEADALQTVLDTLGLVLESPITRSYCNDSKSGGSIKCNCPDASKNLCHITEISLKSKALSGYIHEAVSHLAFLETLDLSSNKLYGTIPDSLGTLSSLTKLNLKDNQLTGYIPNSLGNLQLLTILELSNNQLSGTIPESLGKLSMLTYLGLATNQLTSRIPENLKNLQSLTDLYLDKNFLSGGIPKSLGELSSLQDLSLPYNKLEGKIPDDLGKLTKLVSLILDENLLDGQLPDTLGGLSNLQHLSLTSNNFTGKLPQSYSKLTKLVDFAIAGNSLSGQINSYIKNWVNLTGLNLLGNNFEGPLPAEIFYMTQLEILLVSDLSSSDFSFPENANLSNINQLVLRNCSITGRIPLNIGNWPWLTYLDLSFNKLTGEIPKSLSNKYLSEMYLTGNMLGGMVPGWIDHTVINKADLSYNDFTNGTPDREAKKKNVNPAPNYFTDAKSQKLNIEPTRNYILQMSKDYCRGGKSKYRSLFINSGGEETSIGKNHYEADTSLSNFNVSDKKNWAYTCSGDFLSSTYNSSDYIKNLTCGVDVRDKSLYEKARLCPVSLTYYGFCLHKGSYTVKLHFAEVVYTKNVDYSSLGKRVFDVYVQGKRELKDFNIKKEAGGPNEVRVESIKTQVKDNLLTIHFFWAGKGSFYNPPLLNGPLISAISVTPNFGRLSAWEIAIISIAAILAPLLLLALLWRMGLVGDRELRESRVELRGKSYTVKQIIDATKKFSPKKEIGKGHFGIVYKAELPDQVVAVKKLYPKFMQQEGDQIGNDILTLKSLEHENLVQLLDGYSKKDLHLLIYGGMEHGSLEKALFGPNSPLELKWEARFKICKGIAKGLKYLHEEARLKIVHGDIKTSIILLDGTPNPTAKLSEFGLARFHEEENPFLVTKERRTLTYMAPEYAWKKPITVKADVYSFGVVLLEIVSGKPNADYKDNQETVFLLDKAGDLQSKGRLLELVDRKLSNDYNKKEADIVLNLAMMCINQFPDRRPKMSEVVSVLENEKTIKQISNDVTPAAT